MLRQLDLVKSRRTPCFPAPKIKSLRKNLNLLRKAVWRPETLQKLHNVHPKTSLNVVNHFKCCQQSIPLMKSLSTTCQPRQYQYQKKCSSSSSIAQGCTAPFKGVHTGSTLKVGRVFSRPYLNTCLDLICQHNPLPQEKNSVLTLQLHQYICYKPGLEQFFAKRSMRSSLGAGSEVPPPFRSTLNTSYIRFGHV